MSAPQSSGGRDSETFATAASVSDVEWIEPVFDTDISIEDEQRQTGEIPGVGDASDAVPAPRLGDAAAALITPEVAPLNSIWRSASLRRGRRSSASQGLAPAATVESVKWQGQRSGRHLSVSSRIAPAATLPTTIAADRAFGVNQLNRLNEAISAERAAAASALAALHGTLAAGVLAALHETLTAERELAIARIVTLGAERVAASAEIAPPSGSAVACAAGVPAVSDAASIRTAISLFWRRQDRSRQSIREGTGAASMLAPGSQAYLRRTGAELSARHGSEAKALAKSRRHLLVNAFALLVATVGVVSYYGNDIWSARARQTQPSPATTVVHAPAAPASEAVPSDPVQRVAYFRDRAEAGDATAQYALGVLYAQGEGIAQNYAVAASWFRKAAKGGTVNAEDLAALYERGLATPQDFVVAAYWYRNAAEQGVEPAMTMLALLYERGQGVGASPMDAYAWYRAAARRGDVVAGKHAAALFARFDGAEKGRAVMRAAEIVDALHEPREARSGSARLIPGDWIGRTTDSDHINMN